MRHAGRFRQRVSGSVSIAVALALSGQARATPLDSVVCDGAKTEQSALSDVPHLMERGPDWAKANATPETLQKIARWIELTEILSFRCGRGQITAEAKRAAAAADLMENPPPAPEGNAPAPAADGPVASPAPPAEAAPVPAVAAPAAGVETPAPPAKPAAKAKKRSKPKPAEAAGEEAATVVASPEAAPPRKKHLEKTTPAAPAPEKP